MSVGSFNSVDKVSKFKDKLAGFTKTQGSDKLIYVGVVCLVDKYGGKWQKLGRLTPPNTLKAYIPELDSSPELSSLDFYEPIFPSNICSPPELKEEVLILFDSQQRNRGYWIRRVDSTSINFRTSKPLDLKITNNGDEYEFSDSDEVPDNSEPAPYYRKKSGDIFVEGRSNTAINQTFSIESKKGIIDIITGRDGDVDSTSNLSKIKDREFPDSKGSRIFITTKFNVDKNEDWDLKQKPGFKYLNMTEQRNRTGDKNEHKDTAYIYMESEQFRFVSRTSDEKLNNVILGNNFEVWMCSLIDVLDQMTKVVAESPSQAITITAGYPNSVNLMSGGMIAVRKKLTELRKTIYKTHSKNFFIN